jgi:hypothetical protein
LIAHAADNFQSDLRTFISGERQRTELVTALTDAEIMSAGNAEMLNAVIGIGAGGFQIAKSLDATARTVSRVGDGTNKLTPYRTTLDSEINALRNIGAKNSSVSAQIRNERINLSLYKDALNHDVDSLIAKLDVSSARGASVFWSGNKAAAIEYANLNGKVVLETTAGGRLVDDWSLLNKALPWKNGGEQFWTGISTKYARGTSGDITIVQTPDRALSGTGFDWKGGYVWQNYEKPVIDYYIDTGRVSKINYQLAPNDRYPLNLLLGREF